MKKLLFFFALVSFCQFTHAQSRKPPVKPAQTKTTDNLDVLKKYAGKYPSDVKLFNNQAFSKRLKKLVGDRYGFMVKSFDVQTPIEVNNNVFAATACAPHLCSITDFIVAFDFSKNVLYAGIREDEKVKTYSENGSTCKEVTNWAK